MALVAGIIAGFRTKIAPFIEEGVSRELFKAVTMMLPRLSSLAQASMDLAASTPLGVQSLTMLLVGVFVFGLGVLSVGFWWFEGRDY